jgi:amidase
MHFRPVRLPQYRPAMDIDIATASVLQLGHALRDREISSRELLDLLLARVERLNPALNAIVAFDIERARAEAEAADRQTARGVAGGPLHGLPMTVKDVWETEGLVTTSGAPELAQYVPRADALAVDRLRRAGAIIFGKTNTPLYASDMQTYNDVYGRTGNPWDLTRTPGGSSGGAAAALAAGLTPLELGSDIGGSIRNPAHFTGVYGLKPSWGVVPVRGHIPGPPGSLVTAEVGVAGPLARSVADLRTALSVLAGPLPEDAVAWRLDLDPGPDPGAVSGLRIASVLAEGTDVVPLARDVRGSLESYAARLTDAGARVEAVPLPVPLADGFRVWRDIVQPIIGAGLPEPEFAALAAQGDVAGADSRGGDSSTRAALTSRYRDWIAAVDRRQMQRQAWARLFADYDAVLAPVMPTTAFPHDTAPFGDRVLDVDGTKVPYFFGIAWCAAVGAVLLPVVTLPTGKPEPAGLPVGVQVIGPFLSDLRLLRIAELLDAAAGPGFTPPPLD